MCTERRSAWRGWRYRRSAAWLPITIVFGRPPGDRHESARHATSWRPERDCWLTYTYLATGQGWLHLCAVRDGCSRRVIGYDFADSLHTDVVETALRRAVTFRQGETIGVILHADRGCQYTSTQLANTTGEVACLLLSVGRAGVCWDNAQIECFWSTLKTEFMPR